MDSLGTVKRNSIHFLSTCTCSVSCPCWGPRSLGDQGRGHQCLNVAPHLTWP